MLSELIKKNRSYRRFFEDHKIEKETLVELVDLARLSPSGSNMQPLKYMLSFNKEKNDLIFPFLGWAGYLKDWAGPEEGERPSAYIIILGDKEIKASFGCDHGIAAQSIMLGAVEKGLGGCMIASVNKEKLKTALDISDRFEVLMILALGKPKETILLEEMKDPQDVKYWRDDKQVHHVPKRRIEDIIVK